MKLIILYSLCILGAVSPVHVSAQQLRSVPDSVAERMKNEDEFRYANDPSYWKKEEPKSNSSLQNFLDFLGSPAMKVILYIVLGLIILLVIYQVAVVNNFFVLSRSKRKKTSDGETGQELTPDDIESKLNEAINAGEYRLAIRYLYLKTLNVLNEKNRIKLHAKSTNHDYLDQMRQSPAFGEFAMLTRVYEYVWYGEFVPGQQQFEKISHNFHQFISRS